MIKDAISRVVDGIDLTVEEAGEVMSEMMSGSATHSQMAAFITAMRMKGETQQELLGFAREMRANALKISAPEGAVDLCGTGGDGKGTLNISTIASFVVASAGVPVAKHGNRSVSSKTGSADLLEALGIRFDLPPLAVEECMRRTGFGFMFAPMFHPSMRNVMPARKEIGVRTFFNILGPICSPAFVDRQLIGVYDQQLMRKVAAVLSALGSKRAMVVNSAGTDEITNVEETRVVEVRSGETREYSLRPEDFGVEPAEPASLAGGSPHGNARSALSILRGNQTPGSDAVLMNAAAALYVSGKAPSLNEGMEIASSAVREGRAIAKLREFADVSRGLEAEEQSRSAVESLRSRRLEAEVMKSRCAELTHDLVAQIGQLPGGRDALLDIDRRLLGSPSALSVLMLRRMRGVLESTVEHTQRLHNSSSKLSECLASPGISIIGEYKPRSPTSTPLHVPPDPGHAAEVFSNSGIAAVSVLLEPEYFGGGPEMFAFFRSRLHMPMLFKDFVATERQLDMARELGADAVLLIAKALERSALEHLLEVSHAKGLETVVELHDMDDIRKTEAVRSIRSSDVLGINLRDLGTLETSFEGLETIRSAVPGGHPVIAESGVRTSQDILSLGSFDGVLVGSALMQADDMSVAAAELVAAGRRSTI